MNGMFRVLLGFFVWKELITLNEAKILDNYLGDRLIPLTIEGVVEELRQALK